MNNKRTLDLLRNRESDSFGHVSTEERRYKDWKDNTITQHMPKEVYEALEAQHNLEETPEETSTNLAVPEKKLYLLRYE